MIGSDEMRELHEAQDRVAAYKFLEQVNQGLAYGELEMIDRRLYLTDAGKDMIKSLRR